MRQVLTTVAAVLTLAVAPIAAAAPQVTDQDIRAAVEDELLLDTAVSLNDIDINVQNGIVTLRGEVDSVLSSERAARSATTVRGVEAVINNIDVEPIWDIDEQTLLSDVRYALLWDAALDPGEVTLAIDGNSITLTGSVDSWQEREAYEKAVESVRGVSIVHNQLDVDYAETRPDAEIREDVQQALRWNDAIDDGLIDVAVNNGRVTLSGTVGSAAEKNKALVEAWVAGVESVDTDELTVARWARDPDLQQAKYTGKSDAEIRRAIEESLLREYRVASFNVNTTVDEGTATLRGTVDNLKAKRAASQAAREVVGVTGVRNRIKVRSPEGLSDEQLAKRIRDALERDPFVNRFEISVTVADHDAYLYGDVDSYFERGQADDVVARTEGVEAIHNNLSVEDEAEVFDYDPYVDDWYAYDFDWYDYDPIRTYKSDATIKDDIESEIFWSPFVDSDKVEVTVEDGTATLTGEVGSWSERFAARENAFEGGAVSVINRLTVVN